MRARSDYLCFIDGDSIPHRFFLRSRILQGESRFRRFSEDA